MSHTSHVSIVRRFWKPAVATGMGGTAFAVWFEEITSFVEDILAVFFVFITAGTVYLIDQYFFKSRSLKTKDLEQPMMRGEKK